MPEFVRSPDGTSIAYDRVGEGPSVIVIGGAFTTRLSPYPLVTLLAERFRVVSFDRRGRGASGDSEPYAVEREVEDLTALVAAAGGSAMVYGHSSGAILALEATAAGVPITRLAVYEPPYTFDPAHPPEPGDHGLQAALDAGDREGAARTFLRIVGMDGASIDRAASAPFWPGMVEIAHTLPYDLALTADGRPPVDRLSRIAVPTLVLDGGNSPDWAARAAAGVASAVPNAIRFTMEGQDHGVDQTVLAPILIEFFSAQ
jgi:pimeloyl-ACP methyl ester carboxylesterase